MGMMKGLIGGVVAGLIGAAVWAGISYGTGYEIGWIAWGVGSLVGLGVAWGGERGTPAGVLAVVLSVLAILAGKYAAVELVLNKELADPSQIIAEALADLENDEFVISFLADDVVAAREAQGDTIAWPPGVVPEQAEKESDYPPAIWSAASAQWSKMSPEDRESYRAELGDAIRKGWADPTQIITEALADLDNDEFVISFLADDVAAAREAQGDTIAWPSGVVPEEPERESDYPPAIWSAASAQWSKMSPEDRESYRAELGDMIRKNVEENYGAFRSEISKEAFLSSFGALDIVFMALAVITAFKIAERGEVAAADE